MNQITKFCIPFCRKFQALIRKCQNIFIIFTVELQLSEVTTVSCQVYLTLVVKGLKNTPRFVKVSPIKISNNESVEFSPDLISTSINHALRGV